MTGKARGGFVSVGALLPALLVATVGADTSRGGHEQSEAYEERGFDPRF